VDSDKSAEITAAMAAVEAKVAESDKAGSEGAAVGTAGELLAKRKELLSVATHYLSIMKRRENSTCSPSPPTTSLFILFRAASDPIGLQCPRLVLSGPCLLPDWG